MAKRQQTWQRAARKRKALRIRKAMARRQDETEATPKSKPVKSSTKTKPVKSSTKTRG